jgi:F0F1-type ATP synthase membrane subunit b/b'
MTNLIPILFYLLIVVSVGMGIYAVYVNNAYKNLLQKFFMVKEELKKARDKKEVREDFKEKIDSELEKSADQAREAIKEMGLRMGNELKEKLKGQVVTIDQAAEEAIAIEFDRMREEITEYKRLKIGEVDATAQKMLAEIVRDALGKSLSEEDKQNLVMRALDDAKHRNLF